MIVNVRFFAVMHSASIRCAYGKNKDMEVAIVLYGSGDAVLTALGKRILSEKHQKKINLIKGYLHTSYTHGLLDTRDFKSDLDLKQIKIHGPA